MKDQAATALQPAREMMTPLKPFTSDFLEKVKEINNSIARRAFEMFESNGQTVGRELEHWLKAETEVLHPIHLEMAESDEALTVRAEMPGFSAKDIEVRLEPRRLAIAGKRETQRERKTEKTIYSERCAGKVLRIVDLPVEVNPEKATATLKDGVLELAMRKAPSARRVEAR